MLEASVTLLCGLFVLANIFINDSTQEVEKQNNEKTKEDDQHLQLAAKFCLTMIKRGD